MSVEPARSASKNVTPDLCGGGSRGVFSLGIESSRASVSQSVCRHAFASHCLFRVLKEEVLGGGVMVVRRRDVGESA